jgi:hypothetical protein
MNIIINVTDALDSLNNRLGTLLQKIRRHSSLQSDATVVAKDLQVPKGWISACGKGQIGPSGNLVVRVLPELNSILLYLLDNILNRHNPSLHETVGPDEASNGNRQRLLAVRAHQN